MKILYLVQRYQQLSETYIKTEINALKDDFELKIISIEKPDLADPEYLDYQILFDEKEIIRQIQDFKPDVIHSHYLVMAEYISNISKKVGIPFTLRSHSFDSLQNCLENNVPHHISQLHKHINHDLCVGLLIMPFSLNRLLIEGKVEAGKIIIVPPVVDVRRFYNKEPNGNGIMNTGACLPKKGMRNFVRLSKLLPEKTFNLYGIGYNIEKLKHFNSERTGRVNFVDPVPYSKMPLEYKKHSWLVYTADMEMKIVGWPMAIMEAMAAGTMVCMQNIRPDLKDYIGEAGYLFNQVDELTELLSQPVNEEKREFAFGYSSQFDISKSIGKLTDLWKKI